MVVLVVLLAVLINLVFGQTQTPSDTQSGVIDVLVEQHKKAIEEMRKRYGITKTEGCKYTMDQLRSIAARHDMQAREGGRVFLMLPGPNGPEYFQTFDDQCKIVAYDVSGTLSPASPIAVAPIGQQILTKQDIKFGVDVNLFRVLFQLLMYGAGIFWAVRAVQRFVAGELTEFFFTLLIGFIIVASMYVLYRWIPA
jgi:hypothetical protein